MAVITVIGGMGFIGRHLVDRLSSGGHTIRVVSRSAGGASGSSGVECVRGSVANAEDMLKALEGSEVVYFLATGGGQAWSDYERDFVQGARNVGNACLQHGVKRLVYTSSIAALYLGDAGVLTEADGVDKKPELRSFYSRAKIEAERVLTQLHINSGLPVVIVRPGVVMGRGGLLAHSGIGQWATDITCNGWDSGKHPLPFVLADDIAAAMVSAMQKEGIEGKAFNLVGDVRLTAVEFTRLMAEHSRRRVRFIPQSQVMLQCEEILKWFIKVLARKKENPFPSWRDLKSRSLLTEIDCSAAKQVLGWQPVSSPERFVAEALDSCIHPIQDGDIRKPFIS